MALRQRETGATSETRRQIEHVNAAISVVLGAHEVTAGERRGTDATYAQTMAIWESLHRPFLTHAQAAGTPELQMNGYRRTIEVDPACELAHQYLSIAAGRMTRRGM